jgi:hypothetical protein
MPGQWVQGDADPNPSDTMAPEQGGPEIDLFRAMKADGSIPRLGASATTLGVRLNKDIAEQIDGRVHPETGGVVRDPRERVLAAGMDHERREFWTTDCVHDQARQSWS